MQLLPLPPFGHRPMNLSYSSTATPQLLPRRSLISFPFHSFHGTPIIHRPKLLGLNANSIRAEFDQNGSEKSINSGEIDGGGKTSSIEEESEECVNVIVLGSRKEAVLEFCSGSPLLSPDLRFRSILEYDLEMVNLHQRFTKQDGPSKTMQGLSAWQSTCKAVILVVSAAYGSDHITALDILSDVNSANGFVVGIILKPFRFEGKRRQDEVKDLVIKVQKHANFCIVLDTDALLENDMVTLDEALRTSNNAVLMAINAVSILISEKHTKHLHTKHNSTRDLQLLEFKEIFGSFKEATIAFGIGYNVKTSLFQAINECPFLGMDTKDLEGVILCIFACSGAMDCSDTNTILQTIRTVTGWKSEIIVSIVHEPELEPKAILTTVIVFGYARQQLAPNNSIFSGLGQHFPFIFNIFKKKYQQPINSEVTSNSKDQNASDVIKSPAIGDMPEANSHDGTTDDPSVYSGQPPSYRADEFFSLSNFSGEKEVELLEMNSNYSSTGLNTEGTPVFKRELITRGNLGSGQEFSKYEHHVSEVTTLIASVSIYKLPVGVKHLEKLEDTPLISNIKQGTEWRGEGDEKRQNYGGSRVSRSGIIEPAVNPKEDFNNKVSVNYTSESKRQGGLSVRAASMLESERDSKKKWSRVVKMNYRGGIYRGHVQGGLPEGKGRLLLGDGSIYDGMWRYGKRSGLGTFNFNNGDVFQGSWRDDIMHGKGWYYFHTGDRWFVNFWKGKADGEGRFYSKLGEVFFGHFKEGLRHGQFLRINVNGTRREEVWDEGVFISEKPLDADAEAD